MEIAKFRLQFSTALEQVKVRLWQARFRLRKLRRIAAERAQRVGHELRARGNALRVLLAAKCRKAIVGTSGKIAKAKNRVSIAFQHGTAGLRELRNRFARRKRSIAEKVQKVAEGCCAREDELRGLLATRSREAIVAAKNKIANGRVRVSIAFKQGTARLRQVRNRLGQAPNRWKGLTRSIAEKRQKRTEERRARKDELRVKLAGSAKEVVEADHKVPKTKAQLSIVPGQWTAHLRQAQNPNPLPGLARSIAERPPKQGEERPARELQKPLEEPRARVEELRAQAARPREAVVAANSQSIEVKAQLPIAPEKGTVRLRRMRKTLSGLGRNIVDKRRRKRQELGAREGQMQELLASSLDAIVVISGDHRFVTANRRALDLFGVSERNLSKFNIDAFLFRGQIPELERNGSFFKGRQERHGKCTIRRLDGSLRVAEFALVTEFLPLHVYRFYDLCMPRWPTPIQHRIAPETQHGSHAGQAG